jgi:hypothetical protein
MELGLKRDLVESLSLISLIKIMEAKAIDRKNNC